MQKARFFRKSESFLADSDLVLAFQNMDRFLLLVLDMQRRASFGRNLDYKMVEGSARIFARDLENEIPARAGPESQPLSWG